MDKSIVLKLPDAKSPGFFKFLRGFALFSEVMSQPVGRKSAEIDECLDWLLELVAEPKDRKEARRLVMNLSAEEFGKLIQGMGVAAEADPLP
jgi:hypothetical protein